ncbi:hypothetical protein ACJRO7_011418 [Eucalyptus globulus]|uniref:EGF-like domain-containing protein n=1 Tax=Eucalyptus globulus TaxID=34317 RepID=A0ABD3LIH5_EUCGL
MAFLARLAVLLLVTASAADSLAPFIELCDEVQCGKGLCVLNPSAPLGFECQCEAGWKLTRFDNEDDPKFLPRSVHYSCMPAPRLFPSVPYKTSVFNPCYWIPCRGGTCTESATYEHTCAIGNVYEKLGTKASNLSTTGSDAEVWLLFLIGAHELGKLLWMTIFTASTALVLWN